jgi:bifunctional oligoribonuclease and PAP phosphatase NrnA
MFQRVSEAISKGNHFLITAHVDPDGDALGSAFALYFALKGLGKQGAVYLKDTVPYRYRFLPKPDTILHELPDGGFDVIFVVDCGNLFRVGDGWEKLKEKGYIISIDHHDTNEAFGQLNILDERASSSAEILYLVLKSLNVAFTFDIAVNIYTAILTDTGSFRYESTTKRAFSICEEMTGFGVQPSYVAGQVYENHPKERYDLLCLVLSTLQAYKENRIVTAYVNADMFAKTQTNREYTEGFVEYLKEIRGVEVACLFREVSPEKYKVSMRSKGNVDVASVANIFGGGGHKRAAGCVLEGGIEDVKNKLIGAFFI